MKRILIALFIAASLSAASLAWAKHQGLKARAARPKHRSVEIASVLKVDLPHERYQIARMDRSAQPYEFRRWLGKREVMRRRFNESQYQAIRAQFLSLIVRAPQGARPCHNGIQIEMPEFREKGFACPAQASHYLQTTAALVRLGY